jgi:periplasmic divalent cation tolerance protein
MTGEAGPAIVLTTSNSRALTRTIATRLLEQRLAACVQVAGIHSYYRWQGALQEDDEELLVIKCRADAFDAVSAAIRAVHPYDVPEIVQIPVSAASADYLRWLRAETHVDG